jgi:acetylornithine/N-succinyldiaminopimelate aminotransferase
MKNIIWSSTHQLKHTDIIRAENCTLTDGKGNSWLDLESGVWCTCLGHNHPVINSIIIQQLNAVTHCGFSWCHPVIGEAADKILEIAAFPGGKCEFLASGSEAVEYALRIAKKVSEKPRILAFTESYFGAYGEAAAKPADTFITYDRLHCKCNSTDGCTGNCESFEEIPFDDAGIFLFEPGSSSGLVRFPSAQLIEKITARIKENHGIVVVNEVTTGIGRTGKWFGFQHYDIQPDIVAMGKGIGNGYPVSVVAITAETAEKLKDKNFIFMQSHQNDPMGAAVAKGVIETIQEYDLLTYCKDEGEKLLQQLRAMQQNHPVIRTVRGRGFMIIVEFHSHSQYICEKLLQKGIIVGYRPAAGALRIDPALTIDRNDIKRFMDILEIILKEL